MSDDECRIDVKKRPYVVRALTENCRTLEFESSREASNGITDLFRSGFRSVEV